MSIRMLAGLLAALCLAAPARAGVELTQAGIEDRLMVVFQPGVGEADQKSVAKAHGLEVLLEYKPIHALVVRSGPGLARPAMVGLAGEPRVMHVARDEWRKWIEAAPAEGAGSWLPNLGSLWRRFPKLRKDAGQSAEVQWGVRRVNAPAAWASNQGAGVKVAVVDTGIDPSHPDLAANVKGGHNAVAKDQPWADDHFHGTHVAGIIAATMNGSGVVGVAPQAHLYAVKVLTKDGQGSLFGIIGGIMWCIENGMQVVNMSLGAPQGNFLFEYAVNALRDANIPLIAAAGNGDGQGNPGPVNFPAAYESAIAVSALDDKDAITKFSSRGPEVDFIAPGYKVPSTVPLAHDPSGVKAYSGTSMASPHVAGLAALAVANGAVGASAVRAALEGAAEPLALSPTEQGKGVINAGKLRR